MTDFTFNKNRRPSILVVDDFYAEPERVREFALRQEFREDTRYHKGRRTEERHLFPWVREEFQRLLGVKITDWTQQRYNGVFQFCTPADPLVVHSDSQDYAAVVYLTPNDAVPGSPVLYGTTFYRSMEFGLRASPTLADSDRLGIGHHELTRRMYGGKLLDPGAWEVVDNVGNVFNRLVIWNARQVHAATGYFGSTPADSRLFQLFFFNVAA